MYLIDYICCRFQNEQKTPENTHYLDRYMNTVTAITTSLDAFVSAAPFRVLGDEVLAELQFCFVQHRSDDAMSDCVSF